MARSRPAVSSASWWMDACSFVIGTVSRETIHDRRDPLAQEVQVPVAGGAPASVERRELVVELPQWPEPVRVHDLHEAVQVVEAILDRSPRQNEGKAGPEPLHQGGGAGPPVLHPLGLVEDEQFGRQVDERPANLAAPPELDHGGDGLRRLPEPHLVGEQRAPARGEERDAFHLVRVELPADSGLLRAGSPDLGVDLAATKLAARRVDGALAQPHHLAGDLDARLHRRPRELGPDLFEGAPKQAIGTEEPGSEPPLRGPGALREPDPHRLLGLEDEVEITRRERLPEGPLPPARRVGSKVVKDGLDVLAGPDEVRREVGTGAAVVGEVECTQRDEVGARGRGRDLVLPANPLPAQPAADLEEFGGSPRLAAAALDLSRRRRFILLVGHRGLRLSEHE